MLEGMVSLNQFVNDDRVNKKNKLTGITEMIISHIAYSILQVCHLPGGGGFLSQTPENNVKII